MKQSVVSAAFVVVLYAAAALPAIYTVAKDGSGNFTSIQAAVDMAGVNDQIRIHGSGIYEEQVTIDSTKSGLQLIGLPAQGGAKPVVRYKDILNVHPENVSEAKNPETINYDKNGALRIIGATRIWIEGIVIDGGAPYTFGSDNVWEGGGQAWPMQHGNAALCMLSSGNVVVKNCELQNAFFGAYINDYNSMGFYAIPIVSDGMSAHDAGTAKPLNVGNHSIEYCRIHDNSFGIMFENNMDMGSTVRYNLIYENHHATTPFAEQVKALTSEGGNLPGGAIGFKNDLITPMAIYNNTFWHNMFIFVGGWKAGGQHLLFNNIYAEPFVYYSNESAFGGSTHLDMLKTYANRMHNCVIAAQQQKPSPSYISVTNDLSQPEAEGDTLTKPFPPGAAICYLEMGTKFISTTPASEGFLVPDWTNTYVQKYVVDNGWEMSGVKDPDGSRADLGAVPKAGSQRGPTTVIIPAAPVIVDSTEAVLSFVVKTVGPAGTEEMTSAKATLFGVVRNLDTSDVFGSAYKAIPAANIEAVTLGTYEVNVGVTNTIRVPKAMLKESDYSFFEVIVAGRNGENAACPSTVGFLPYRKSDWTIRVEILNRARTELLREVQPGDTFSVRVAVVKIADGTLFTTAIKKVTVETLFGNYLTITDGDKVRAMYDSIIGVTTFDAVFSAESKGGNENIVVYGSRTADAGYSGAPWFVGCSNNVVVLHDTSAVVQGRPAARFRAKKVVAELIDCSGRLVHRWNAGRYDEHRALRLPAIATGRGVYFVRIVDAETGARVIEKRMVLSTVNGPMGRTLP